MDLNEIPSTKPGRPIKSEEPNTGRTIANPIPDKSAGEVLRVFKLPEGSAGRVIGTRGGILRGIKLKTKTEIRINPTTDGVGRAAYIVGTSRNVDRAKTEIMEIANQTGLRPAPKGDSPAAKKKR